MDLKEYIRDFPDFPKTGILFRDISPILRSHDVMCYVVDQIYEYFKDKDIDLVAGTESRGLIFASVLAMRFGAGSMMVRKQGKLPGPVEKIAYDIEYGNAIMEVQIDTVEKGQNVLVVDDLLATGGTASAAAHLVEKVGGNVVGFAFVIELAALKGRAALGDYDIQTLVTYYD